MKTKFRKKFYQNSKLRLKCRFIKVTKLIFDSVWTQQDKKQMNDNNSDAHDPTGTKSISVTDMFFFLADSGNIFFEVYNNPYPSVSQKTIWTILKFAIVITQ